MPESTTTHKNPLTANPIEPDRFTLIKSNQKQTGRESIVPMDWVLQFGSGSNF